MRLLLLILPLISAIPLQNAEKKYDLLIENGTLKYVKFIEPSNTLDLSSLELRGLESGALDHVPDVKILNLANNSLSNLPHLIFKYLNNLEKLSLAKNKIDNFEYLFPGLLNLKELDISDNPVSRIQQGDLFGLPKSAKILIESNVISSINTDVLANLFLNNENNKKEGKENEESANTMEATERKIREIEMEEEREIFHRFKRDISGQLEENPRAKLCMSDDGADVASVSSLNDKETLPRGCQEVTFDKNSGLLDLRNMNIRSFQRGWYQISTFPVSSIDLGNNEITELTKELLNDLPSSVELVNLANNLINRLRNDVIDNRYLKRLNFKNNLITTVEPNAFSKTNLISLFLANNQLENLGFVQTLPSSLSHLVLTSNKISSIRRGDLSNPKHLAYINMGNNKITKLLNHAFEGQESLPVLILTRNSISEIEPRAFSDLKKLTTLYLYQNLINKLPRNVFADLTNLQELNLMNNKFTVISDESFPLLPKSLSSLNLDGNEIKSLEKGSFVEVPQRSLSLQNNQISTIASGAFRLPNLRNLYLSNNTLTTINGDSYQGLPKLWLLTLSNNKISNIEKGSCQYLASINNLDISGNPFQRLKSGAFYGLTIDKDNSVSIKGNQLKSMQPGIFEDA